MDCKEIGFSDELEIKCLIRKGPQCPYRVLLNQIFGYPDKSNCVYRDALKFEFEKHLAWKENEKHQQEYPNG